MMTDIWCFTCSHELARITGTRDYQHADHDDEQDCVCIDDGEKCQP